MPAAAEQPSFFKPLIDGIKIWGTDLENLYGFLAEQAAIGWAATREALFTVLDTYSYLTSFSDPKLVDWPLMGGPCMPLFVLFCYLAIVHQGQTVVATPLTTTAGRSHHHKRGHHHHHHHHHHHLFDLKHFVQRPLFGYLLVLYNLAMAALNAWIAGELIYCAVKRRYNFLCQTVYTGTDDPYETRIAEAIWWYFASKGFELLDTVFIILKRKSAQLTFLHCYHHSSMFAVWWVAAKFVPGGSALTAALVNCVVHVIMYSYYAASAMGPRLKPYLWWKKYLTIIQLIQFTLGVSLGLNSIFSHCPFTRWMQYVFVAYAFSFLVLFGNFYRSTYYLGSGGQSTASESKTSPSASKIKRSPQSADLTSFFGNLTSSPSPPATSSPTNGGNSGSGSDSGSTATTVAKKGSGGGGGRHSKQSKLSMLTAKHNYGQMGRRKKVKSG